MTRLLTASAFVALSFGASAADPLVGNWKLNPEKSSGINTAVSKFERDGEFIKNTNGPMSYRFKFDGKENPVQGSALYDTASWKRIGPGKFEHAMKKDGKLVYSVSTTIMPDGKSRSWSQTRTLPGGRTVTSEGIQERSGGETDASSPLLGNWRQIPIMKIEESGQGIRVRGGISYTANIDGKDYPVAGSNNVDAVSLRRVDARSVEQSSKKGGKVNVTSQWAVSGDGKTLTITSKGTRANGEPFNSVGVWERR